MELDKIACGSDALAFQMDRWLKWSPELSPPPWQSPPIRQHCYLPLPAALHIVSGEQETEISSLVLVEGAGVVQRGGVAGVALGAELRW